ncbi:MAG: cation-translocating P-type ATPase [Bacillota bacterium]|jgi:Ca2+-transporting ATPase
MAQTKWYQREIAAITRELASNLTTGLDKAAVSAKREQYGPNELTEKAGRSLGAMFFDQFKEFLIILLFIAALISGFLGEWLDSIVILIIVALNAFLGVIQEYKAEQSLAALKKLSAPLAKVIRDRQVRQIPARDLVPGDLFILESGDYVPVDGRLFEAANLKVEESALTGESVPVEKTVTVYSEELPLADRKNTVYMGTIVTYGRGKGIVTGTGMRTEIGQIAALIQNVAPETTPLQEKLEEFGKYLGVLALGVCAVIFVMGWLRGEKLMTMFLTAVSLAVAAIPEGLPAIVTIVLALGVQRLARQRAIIRKLPAVETLGAATVICSDKTGTLTQNQMTVRRVYAAGKFYEVTGQGYQPVGEFLVDGLSVPVAEQGALRLTLLAGALCNDANIISETIENREVWKIVGDPTEGALVVVAAKVGLEQARLSESYPRVLEIPFDSGRKLMTTIHQGSLPEQHLRQIEAAGPDGLWAITKGAPDMVLQRCNAYLTPNGVVGLEPEAREELLQVNAGMARQALRVLGVAVRRLPEVGQIQLDQVEADLIFVGFWGMIDPPRLEARAAIAECQKAGILPVMITGDHRETAAAIATELGLLSRDQLVLNGQELDRLSKAELDAQVEQVAVYARVSPENKVRIVDAFRQKGHVVAMTGDGVNDAPALKRADIGAAMGITGTDVAKGAAEMVLADDNFTTIVGAVREGRIIYENIKKAIYFLLSCNIGEILTILLAILLRYPVPLLAIQILWVNLVTDSLPALALGMEPVEPGIMDRKPRRKDAGVFEAGMKRSIFLEGLGIGGFALLAFTIGWKFHGNVDQARTMAFATLSFSQLVHVFNFRSIKESIFKRGMAPNRFLWGAVVISGLFQLVVMLIPLFREIFSLTVLDFKHWFYVALLSLASIPLVELWKATYLKKFGR